MENKDSKFKWNKKNNGTLFGLCLVGVAAFSVLFATGQVKQAQREQEQLVNEQAALENNLAENADISVMPQVDAALQNALEEPENLLDEALTVEGMPESLAEANSNGAAEVTVEGEANLAEADEENLTGEKDLETGAEGEADLQGEEAGLSADASEEAQAVSVSGTDIAAQTTEILPTVTFDEADTLSWPVAGNVVLDYSMDGSIYFPTLQQYKYNPALVIGSDEGAQVVASAKGIVESIDVDNETGTTITMSLGNGYKLKYGQLQDLAVAEGDVVNQGELIGYVSQPTKYYCVEGNNLYFAMTKDETPVDPILYLE